MLLINITYLQWDPYKKKRNQSIFTEAVLNGGFFKQGIFINPPESLGDILNKKGTMEPTTNRTKNDRIRIFTPIFFLPFAYRSFVSSATAKIIASQLKSKFIKNHEYVLWINTTGRLSIALVKELKKKAKKVIFDFSDDFTTFDGLDSDIEIARLQEVLEWCDDVVFVNDAVMSKFRHPSKHVFYNCTDYSAMQKIKPIQIQNIFPKKQNEIYIGFTGSLVDRRLDLMLLDTLFQKFKKYKFVFVGTTNSSEINDFLKKYSNVVFVPSVDYEYLPFVISQFNVAIVPHSDNEHTRGNDLLKILDYMAVGVPIVSTNTSNISRFEDVVLVADTHDLFCQFIENVIKDRGLIQCRIDKGKEVAMSYSWNEKVAGLFHTLMKT